ncbi:flagellar protein FlhE [Pectobacterium parmentieri]|uniref:Flagellar protein FlhE n=1 Tax=Pectobacterium parmentieri TaxID=1905730 RepID=A0A8B3FBT8_PECPM|nr:flagellar protein FlhE [Pectobacterium parmentieri]AOR59148.1 flagellar protein [Pectobacterium parmentieri]AYH05379.1 flagellar protein FlhE [Pectobacterium parmentieri]AYH09833.1 flagellar protein FlhE [Pectobacterium parmentieri]AYH14201.1 flagellar protein FlhE [Pectobacterium parmentieri]AYH19457.1 flagellar protein FlhE [Pectobacterium parmentieri]
MKKVIGYLAATIVLALPLCAIATPGSWNGSQPGIKLDYRGEMITTSAFAPNTVLKPDETITTIYWRYAIDSVIPTGLVVKLCSQSPQRCVDLNGSGDGQTRAFDGLAANNEFRFVYYIEGNGRINHTFIVRTIDIAVNYK